MGKLGEIKKVTGIALILLFLLSIPLTVGALGGMALGFFPTEETYTYDVKAQQVFDGDRVNDGDITEFEDLSNDEREILYRAFKNTDHFMGSSEVRINTGTERFETFHDWRTVESNGVLLLVAISEDTQQQPDHEEYEWHHWVMIGGMIYFLMGWTLILITPPV